MLSTAFSLKSSFKVSPQAIAVQKRPTGTPVSCKARHCASLSSRSLSGRQVHVPTTARCHRLRRVAHTAGGGIVMAASDTIDLLGSVMAAEKSGLSPSGDLAAACKNVAVLFDFDGTLGDTETPAMEVAYWELAPYFAGTTPADHTQTNCNEFIRDNAGKAFEHMVEVVEEARAKAGLPSISELKASKSEDPAVLAVVDVARAKFGLPTFKALRSGEAKEQADFLTMQKDETVEALATLAKACTGVHATLETLIALGVRSAIATTSGKPRVPVSVVAAELTKYFPAEKIHSGESDFTPPRFKPDPAVYLLAAKTEKVDPADAIAVEDSASGVGSASNAAIGLIVGYVGGSHIGAEVTDSHARMLMAGTRADNGVGCQIVISDMLELPKIVAFFAMERAQGRSAPFTFPEDLLVSISGKYWV